MPRAPHLFIGTFDTPPARLPLALGIARHLHHAVAAAGATVFRPLPAERVARDPRHWGRGMPGVRGLVSTPEGFPPERPDLVIAIRLRGVDAPSQLEIFVISPLGEVLARHFGTGAAPSHVACIAAALASTNELAQLGIPDPFTRPELVTAMADARTPAGTLRCLEVHGRAAMRTAGVAEPQGRSDPSAPGFLVPGDVQSEAA